MVLFCFKCDMLSMQVVSSVNCKLEGTLNLNELCYLA